jgi:hypothetical protein
MAMPEAAMHENHFTPSTEYDVGPAKQAFVVKPVAIAYPPNQMTHHFFGLGVYAPNAAHPFTALVWRDRVRR